LYLNTPQRPDFRSFYLLNATQFLGALNDNVFKLLVIYLLINVKGPAAANTILSLAGAIFVMPFLLFSSGSGVLADRLSKRTIIVFAKIIEVLVACFGLVATIYESEVGLYVALFCLASHSALFGPSKYGIIIELLGDSKWLSWANGLMTSFTYTAIIFGTFLASFIVDITHKNFVACAIASVTIATLGFLFSLGIKRTAPRNSPKKINPVFLYEIYQTLRASWSLPQLIPTIFGSSFFLFIGAFTQLNIIPFAMQALNLSEVGGGYLFLAMAVGIAMGAVLAGKLSKNQIEPGISCICGFIVAFLFMALHFCSGSLTMTIAILGLLGMFGGAFLIPFDSFIQYKSPDKMRGQIIAANNFCSFVGVLFAAFWLFLFNEELGFSATSGFLIMGIFTLFVDIILTGRLSASFFPFFVKKILKRFRTLSLSTAIPPPSSVVLLQSKSWWDAILLFWCLPNLKILVPGSFFSHFPWFNGFIESISLIPSELDSPKTYQKWYHAIKEMQSKGATVCIFLRSKESPETYIRGLEKMHFHVSHAHGKKERIHQHFLGIPWIKKRITIGFHNK
jgi:acyl-[acyl-carrier-protein]-phospholipid O-acyltransferase/long-chain-fatty-acid--[acyl-carrier-protein] ligase